MKHSTHHISKFGQVLAVSGLILALSTAAVAEPKQGHLDRKVARMQDRLKLSDEQADKIYSELKTVKADKDCSAVETYSKRRACKEEKRGLMKEKVSAVLTEEQRVEFAKMKEEKSKHCGWKKHHEGKAADKMN